MNQETVVATSPQGHSWPTKTGFDGDTVQHKAEVQPIFLAFHRVQSAQGGRIPLFQIAATVTEAVGPGLLDTVQPLHSGWYIYMKTLADRQSLIQSGITEVCKHIFLRSESQQASHSAVKITLKDLPLHTITNEAVLEALKEYCLVQSEVHYSNLWHDGKPTCICNGNCFAYVVLTDILKLPDTVIVAGSVACVFKPKLMVVCKRCGKQGHCPGDVHCPARVPEDLVNDIKAFCGAGNELSNLYVCPQGCKIADHGTEFLSSEYHYQFKKLKHHDQGEHAYLLPGEEDAFKVMHQAKELVPETNISQEWVDCCGQNA